MVTSGNEPFHANESISLLIRNIRHTAKGWGGALTIHYTCSKDSNDDSMIFLRFVLAPWPSFPKSLDSAGHIIQNDFGRFVTPFSPSSCLLIA